MNNRVLTEPQQSHNRALISALISLNNRQFHLAAEEARRAWAGEEVEITSDTLVTWLTAAARAGIGVSSTNGSQLY